MTRARRFRRNAAQELQSADISAGLLAGAARRAAPWQRRVLDHHHAHCQAAIDALRRHIARLPAEVPYV